MSDVTTTSPITLTDAAAAKVKDLMAQEENPAEVSLRVAVQPGGCSGMRYALFFDDRQLEGDLVAEIGGVPVRVDKMSAPHLEGTEIDWVDSLMGAGFSINNPNAKGSCACGDSFH
jgi:iron-sulfur cluster assembly accessory protein